MFISATHLHRAEWRNVVRLARALGIKARVGASSEKRSHVISTLVVACNWRVQ